MGLKITAVGLILVALTAIGMSGFPVIVTGIILLIGAIGVLAGY